ncbi:hypothetical protein OPT61_g10387 [Boeremia exigua]|uniref:Uncharacterized protein n=1 Tax=Boeremia exigua TaxID=749465 RepID=A0ACC2HPW1_9PLEO|nr:hypothetical protein OPT61_g10387 [Boeremia exigua]
MRVRFKWLTIRSNRAFNADELYALFSWVLAAHVAWVILGTTTFFMLTVFLINTAFSQETLAKWIGNYLTKSSGIKVVFETAVVPKWGDGVISFRNVFVSRRPGHGRGNVTKGSQTAAAEAAIAHADAPAHVEDTNYTQFDVSIDTVNVTLSFSKWFNGKGLLKDVDIKGVRGVFDRTSVHTVDGVDPRSYKHEHSPGDFELDSFKMEDLLVTIYQPDGFRPFPVSIYSCELPQLRKQWLFYDFLSANIMSGSFDGSLFTVHPRQSHSYTGLGQDESGAAWKKHSRIRIDALNIDHLNRGYDGPFSWIHEGNVDIVADVMLPSDDDESLAKVMSDMYDRVEATVSHNGRKHHFSDHAHGFDDDEADEAGSDEDARFVIMDLRVHLNDVRAAVPLFTRDISYVNNALVRPIVAYINSKRTFIPVNCRVVKNARDFDGSWTLYDSGLMEEVSREMYDAFARDVLDDRTVRKRRIKKVGIWTLQLAAQALFLGLAGNMAEPKKSIRRALKSLGRALKSLGRDLRSLKEPNKSLEEPKKKEPLRDTQANTQEDILKDTPKTLKDILHTLKHTPKRTPKQNIHPRAPRTTRYGTAQQHTTTHTSYTPSVRYDTRLSTSASTSGLAFALIWHGARR